MFNAMGRTSTTGAPAPVGHTKLGEKPTVNKGAKTRFNNDQVAAAQRMMQNSAGGSSAASALKPRSGSTSGNRTAPPQQLAQNYSAAQQPALPGPSNGPSQLLETAPPADPLTMLRAQINLQEFLGSPEFGDAVTNNRLKNYFKTGTDESETMGAQVLSDLAGLSRERGLR